MTGPRQKRDLREPTVFELSVPGRRGWRLPELDVDEVDPARAFGEENLRSEPAGLPALSEPEVARHFARLAELNYHIERSVYPLGSCTMKYNPKVNEDVARLAGFTRLHPETDAASSQGALSLMYNLSRHLCEISGMDAVSLEPPAGASGELTGMLIARAHHRERGEDRHKVIVPDSAHGTNPASLTLAGFTPVELKSGPDGRVDVDALRKAVGEDTAGVMITNPNTLGVFESRIGDVIDIVHGVGGLVYLDGANLNASLGIVRPGDVGFDMMHFNLHKTFSAPHGGGGPGAGPVGVKSFLKEYLPRPLPARDERRSRGVEYYMDHEGERSIGKVHSWYGNFLVMVKAYAYILALGPEGLRRVAENAVLNANYLQEKLKDVYELPYDGRCQHEFVLSASRQKAGGVKALDVAKRLLDLGLHAPTVYFPLIVKEALMIEPTETESRRSLDGFVEAMRRIAREAEEDPEKVTRAPVATPVGRLDEVRAARELDVVWEGD